MYVFRRTGITWAQEAYLKAPNAESWDSFGNSVALSGDTVAVGSVSGGSNQTTITNGTHASPTVLISISGAVYIFKRTGVTWTHESYLKPPNADASSFSYVTVAVSGDTVAVGSYIESSNVYYGGAVYIFVRK